MIPVARLRAVPFFAAFPAAAVQVMADRAIERRYAAGEALFRAGDAPIGLVVVLEGMVRVVRQAGMRAQVVHVERAGGTLGEVPLFAGGGYPATAIAAESTSCAIIGREVLAAALRASPDAAFVLLERLARRVREVVERLDRSALRPVSARLAEFLVARSAGRGRTTIALGMTQQQLADELGTVREVIVRELQTLRASGVVRSLGGGRYEMLDLPALRARCTDGSPSSSPVAEPTESRTAQKVNRQASPKSAPTVGVGEAPRKNLSRRLPGR